MTDTLPDFSSVMPEDHHHEDRLEQLVALASAQKTAEADVVDAEGTLRRAKAALHDLSEVAIPELMDDLGMESFSLSDGSKIQKIVKVRASIPKANAAEAFAYLEQHDASDLISRKFEITFSKEEEAWAREFADDLAKRKKPVALKASKTVHPASLAKWARLRLEAGDELPMQLFGAFRQTMTKITLPKCGGMR